MITEDKVIEIFYMADEYSKLHLIINDRGETLNFMITPGNTDDRKPLRNERYVQDSSGKLCGDRGYIGKALFEMLFINGIQLVTRVRNNMRKAVSPGTFRMRSRRRTRWRVRKG